MYAQKAYNTVKLKVTDRPKARKDNSMKYLNSHKDELFDGRKVTYRGKVYWANMVTMEIYCHSVDEEILGSISGYKVADIIPGTWEIKQI